MHRLGAYYLLVEARSIGVFVLLYNGHYKGDEFGPEVQVLDAGTLFFWRNFPLFALETPAYHSDRSQEFQVIVTK